MRLVAVPIAVVIVASSAASSATGQANAVRVVDRTTSLGRLNPDGTQQVQSVVNVAVGLPSRDSLPACAVSGAANSAATCVNVCVRLPPGSEVTKIEGLAAEGASPWSPCTIGSCLGRRAELTKAMFDPAGPTKERVFGMDRVCWVFRNWHTTSSRTAILLTTFRAPPPETWRAVAESYPWRVLQSKIEATTGPSPIDCGQHRDGSWAEASGKPRDDAAVLKESLACAQRASEKKMPFWTAQETRGVDSASVVGFVGLRDGSIHIFSSCLGCEDEIAMKRCVVPEIQVSGRRQVFGCARSN